MPDPAFLPYHRETYDPETMLARSASFADWLDLRRSVRQFSDQPVAKAVIEQCIRAAATAPSGAHKQPWTFCAINDPALKKQIRLAAEEEEYRSYHGRMSEEWLEDLQPFGTDWHKPFLETAPWLIVVFKRNYEWVDGKKRQNYYVQESVGIASGLLLTALHHAGLATLTHTPSPMDFLKKLLHRPDNERPLLLIPVGYPAADAQVPDLKRKPMEEVALFFE